CWVVSARSPNSLQRRRARRLQRRRANRSPLEHFQEKCEAVFRQEMRKNKKIERFRDTVQIGNALVEPIAADRHLIGIGCKGRVAGKPV
ncbi:MAG: hypothetical protein ACREEJ_05290, partial [Ensifer adhaerens]